MFRIKVTSTLLFLLISLGGVGVLRAQEVSSGNDPTITSRTAPSLGDNRGVTGTYAGEVAPAETGEVDGIVPVPEIPFINLNILQPETNQEVALSLQLLLLLTILTLAPTIAVLLTSFLRISMVLDFVKRALSLQQSPPTSILMGISLFVTVFVMWPVINTIYQTAFQPFSQGQLNQIQLYEYSRGPLKQFMYQQMNGSHESLELFIGISGTPRPETLEDIPMQVLIPAFILHELKVAFQIGIRIYIPFIVIDMVVASILMSMGMIMLPPVMISMPFKLILFVLVDGWGLIIGQLVESVRQNMGGLV